MTEPQNPNRAKTQDAGAAAAPPWPGSEKTRTRTIWVRTPETETARREWGARIRSGGFARVYCLHCDEAKAWIRELTEAGREARQEFVELPASSTQFPWDEAHGGAGGRDVLVIATPEFLARSVTLALGGERVTLDMSLDPGHVAIVDIDTRGIALRAVNWPRFD